MEDGGKAKTILYEETIQMVNAYGNGWQSRFNHLMKVVEEAFDTLITVIRAASDAPPVPVPHSQNDTPVLRLRLTPRLFLQVLELSPS